MIRVSGDFYRMSGGTLTYHGSFVVSSPIVEATVDVVVIEGEGAFSFETTSRRLRVTIPRTTVLATAAPATAEFLSSAGVPGPTYTCAFESPLFRRVEFEQDAVESIAPFTSYDTGLLPSGGPARVLSVRAALAEAGVEMIETDAANAVPITLSGADTVWTKSEMHAAMVQHFSKWANEPGWRVWLLAATRDDEGNRGIMFDKQGSQRQGCAVFHNVIGGSTDAIVRAMLRTYVHEIGHCFNLYHSFHKVYMTPPQPNRLDALSWMHYPDSFVSATGSGKAAYWAAFPFQFDDEEVVHLRHAYRNQIIMGGNAFGVGASETDAHNFADALEDRSGLQLTLRTRKSVALGEPVVIEIELVATDTRGKLVNGRIHPNQGYVQVGVFRPDGKTVVYRPLMQSCADPESTRLDKERPSISDSAYIGYGRDGFYFDNPGAYQLRAVYHAIDGSRVLSNVARLRVRPPASTEGEEVAELFLGDAQGQLLSLLGSDSEHLKAGNDALDTVLDRHPGHPMSVYAKLVKGVNASRSFKTIHDRAVRVRPPQAAEGTRLLADVVDASINPPRDAMAESGLDNMTLSMVMNRLADVQSAAGDLDGARATARLMLRRAESSGVPPHVAALMRNSAAGHLGGERD